MSEEAAPRRSTRSLARRQSTDTPSPPHVGGTPVKRTRSARVALLSSIAETNAPANNVSKAVEENGENSQDSSKQRSSSLSTVDSPKPKRGRRSLLTEEAVASLEPVRRSRRLSTSSEVSVDIAEDVSRSSTPVKGVTRRTRRLSIDSEDNSNATRTHAVSALPVVEVIQEEELNILSTSNDNNVSNTSKHASVVDQFAVSSEPTNEGVIVNEPEALGTGLNTSAEKSIETEITPTKATNTSPKPTTPRNSATVSKTFITKSSPDSTTSQLKPTENDVGKEQISAHNTPVVEQLKSKTPSTSSCEIEITVTDPANRTKSLTDIGDLNKSDLKNAPTVKSPKTSKVSQTDSLNVSKEVTDASNSSKNDKKEGSVTKEIKNDKSSDKTAVSTELEPNLESSTSECGSALHLSIDTSNSLMADSTNTENAETSLKSDPVSNEDVFLPTSENEPIKATEEEKVHKSPKLVKTQTPSSNDTEKPLDKSVSETVQEMSKEEQKNTSITSPRRSNIATETDEKLNISSSSETNLNVTVEDSESMDKTEVSKKELNVSATSVNEKSVTTSPISEKILKQADVSAKSQNDSVASENEFNVSGKEVNKSAGPEQENIISDTSQLNSSTVSENQLHKSIVDEKQNTSFKEINSPTTKKELVDSEVLKESKPQEKLNTSVSAIDANVSPSSKKESYKARLSAEKLNVSSLSEKELNVSTHEEELDGSAISEKEMNKSTAGEELNQSVITEKAQNNSAKDMQVSPVSNKESIKPIHSAEKINVLSSEKELNVSTHEKELDVSAMSEKEMNKSTTSEELNQSAIIEKDQNHSANSAKDINVSPASKKESDKARLSAENLNISSVSEKELNMSTQDEKLNESIATKEIKQSEVTEQEHNHSLNSSKEFNVSKKDMDVSAGSNKELNVSIDSKHEQNNSFNKKVDEGKDESKCKKTENTSVGTAKNAKKTPVKKLVEDKETTSLVISDDSDVESECNAKEYLKLNSDSDSSDYVDNEAKDMGEDYESHDSMDDDEKDTERDNKFLEAGESIESSDGEQLDDDYEHDSFCVESRSEDEDLLEGESDDLDSRSSSGLSDLSQSQAAKDKYNSRRLKKRISVVLDSSSDMAEECKDAAQSDNEKDAETISSIVNGSKIPAKDLSKTLLNAAEEIKQLRNMSNIESESSDNSEDNKIKNQYQDVLDELNSKHQVENREEDDLNASKGTLQKATSLNSSKTIECTAVITSPNQPKEKCSPIETAADGINKQDIPHDSSIELRKNDENRASGDNDSEMVKAPSTNGDASVQNNSPSHNSVKTDSTKDCNKIAACGSTSELICIDESESEVDLVVEPKNQISAIAPSNTSEFTGGSSGVLREDCKNPLKRKLKDQNKINLNNIDLNKIQAACDQIMQKEIEKKRVRRESDNQSKAKKPIKVLNTEKTSKLKRLPEATLKELDEIELTSENITKLNNGIKEKDQSVKDKKEKDTKQKKNSPNSLNNMKRLPEKTLDELFDSENESGSLINVEKKPAPSTTKVFDKKTSISHKENKISAQLQSRKALLGTTLSEISNTNKKSNKEPLRKKSKLDRENIPKATTYFEVTSTKKEKKGIAPPTSAGFQVTNLKTKVIGTSAEGCTTIFKIESSKKINVKAVLGTVAGNEVINFKQGALTKNVPRREKGLIQARKNKQRALASRK